MLAGHFSVENVLALVFGLVGLLIAVDVLRPNSIIEGAIDDELRKTRSGRVRLAAHRRWMTVLAGIFALISFLFGILLGLFVDLSGQLTWS